MNANAERNALILKEIKRHKLSYAVIAKLHGVSRNVVAGLAFRAKHPSKTMVSSPNSRGGNKTGKGYQPQSYQPKVNAKILAEMMAY